MGQIDVAVKYAKKIETILENKYNAEGKGLHEKLDGLNGILDENIIKKARYIATIRNKVVHEDEYDIEDIEDFIETAKEIISTLSDDNRIDCEKDFQLDSNINDDFYHNDEKYLNIKNPSTASKVIKPIFNFVVLIIKFIVFMFFIIFGISLLAAFFGDKMAPGYSIFPIIIFLVIVYSIYSKSKTPSFDRYLKKYPEMMKNGKIKCIKCGGNSIYIQKYGHTPFTILNNHICRTCGTTLYRSRTN